MSTNQAAQSLVFKGQNIFLVSATLFMTAALLLTAIAPISMSVGIVFLFAGPHNYVEARYFLARLPARMGRLRSFFVFSAAGILLLTISLPILARVPLWMQWPNVSILYMVGLWNTALILWGTTLVWMRSRQPPRQNWDYAWPIGIGLIGFAWLQPILLPLLLVFVHPLMGLWVLDREIARSRPAWQQAYRGCLMLLPVFLFLLWTIGPNTAADSLWFEIPTRIQGQIGQHVGANLLTFINPTRLIATHAFLELLHYAVWLVAVPSANGRVFRETFRGIPLMRRSGAVRAAINTMLVASAMIVAVLWLCFTADYSTTRDVYFSVATLHVLAEVPFLLRLL